MRHFLFLATHAALAILLPAPASARQRDCVSPSARAGRYAEVNGLRTSCHLRIESAILGPSMGGPTAIRVASRHRALVWELVVISSGFDRSGPAPEVPQLMAGIDPENGPWTENGQLAIFSGTDHFPGMVDRGDWQLSISPAFLDALPTSR